MSSIGIINGFRPILLQNVIFSLKSLAKTPEYVYLCSTMTRFYAYYYSAFYFFGIKSGFYAV